MQNHKLRSIRKQIRVVKQELFKIEEMRPGTLTKQFLTRNKTMYPYYQLSYTSNMKSHTNYIRPEFVNDIRQQVINYRRFRKLVKRWVDLATKYSKLKIKLALKQR